MLIHQHVLRNEVLLREIIERRMKGKTSRGRKRLLCVAETFLCCSISKLPVVQLQTDNVAHHCHRYTNGLEV